MIYKATTYYKYSIGVEEIKGGHTERLETDYQLRPEDEISFKDLPGRYHVVKVDFNIKDNIIDLLCAPIC